MLGTAVVNIANAATIHNTIRAFIDTGSQLNLITRQAVKRLGLKPTPTKLNMLGAQSTDLAQAEGSVILRIEINPISTILAVFYVVPSITDNLPVVPMPKLDCFARIKLADPNYQLPSPIDALFGIRMWIKIAQSGVIRSPDNLAMAQATDLGYVVFQVQRLPCPPSTYPHVMTIQAEKPDCSRIMQKFWEVENVPDMQPRTLEQQVCEDHFLKTHKRDNTGRYVVSMPFNEKINMLGRSKNIALKQLFATERRMATNKKFAEDYRNYMKEFEENGYMTKISENHESGYYTPHHGVYGASKDKIRVVLNASQQTSSGISLNDCQLTGEKLQDDLMNLLMKFRTHKVGVSGDIKAMYCQVAVCDKDKNKQKILWRASTDEPIGVYQLNRVAFGQTAAPFMAIRGMRQCAVDHIEKYPIGADEVLNSFYVDDYLGGDDTPERCIEKCIQLDETLKEGRFTIAKWCSNNAQVNEALKGETTDIEIRDPEMKSVLGLRWIPSADELAFKVDKIGDGSNWTKRKIVSHIGKLYDPNGYLAPIVIIAKILIQELWLAAVDWDDPAPPQILQNWLEFIQQIPDIGQIRIPRWLGTKSTLQSELHGFSDASLLAYGCCVYIKTIQEDGSIKIRLVQSKTRVAPLKTLTIPRLELCGAHLLVKLMKTIKITLPNKISACWCWTDSEIVLQWMRKSPNNLKTFVGNRIAYIQHETAENSLKWQWVASEQNPADLASRGVPPTKLIENNLWWTGPQWLNKSEREWPQHEINSEQKIDIPELKPISNTVIIRNPELFRGPWYRHNIKNLEPTGILDTYSNLRQMVLTVATTMRAIHNFKSKIARFNLEPIYGQLTQEEKGKARMEIIRMDQAQTFERELREIKTTGEKLSISKGRSIWFDESTSLLRLFGRVLSENLTYDEQFPILISQHGKLAKLLMKQAHEVTLHGGTQQLLQLIRQNYWIFGARRIAKATIDSCKVCKRLKFKSMQQLMASLPAARTTPARPFKISGVDYMGPVNIASRKGRAPAIVKGYVCLFICFVTRAIHLELVSDNTSEAFIQALRRFVGRRGQVAQIWSDNALNFVGANNYLSRIAQTQYDCVLGNKQFKEMNIEWKFIAPRAPSWGGFWEAGVKSIKKHLIRVIGTQNFTFEEYATLLAQVEACVNSRPISPLSDDASDLVALTPGHFLIGESFTTLTEPQVLYDKNPSRLNRWELVQSFNQEIWRRWHTEYITTLAARSKWTSKTRNLQLNDLVIISDEKMPPSRWLTGRVIEVHPSKDGLVRAATLRTMFGEYVRPITKLALLLEHQDDNNEQNQAHRDFDISNI